MNKYELTIAIDKNKNLLIGKDYQEIKESYNKVINNIIELLIHNEEDEEEIEEVLEGVGISKEDFLLASMEINSFDFLKEAEKRLDIKLPPSYVDFIKSEGVCGFFDDDYVMFGSDKYNTIDCLSNKYDFGVETLNEETKRKEVTDKLIVFALGDESMQECYYVCFNYHSLNTETGEVDIHFFNQGNYPAMFECLNTEVPIKTSMEQFIKGICQRRLELFYCYVDEYIDSL